MKKKPIRLLIYCLLIFSLTALACTSFTNFGDEFAITQTALAHYVSTQVVNGENIEQTVVAGITAAVSDDIILTTVAYATQIAEQGAYNVTPPGYVVSALPPGFGSGNVPSDIPLMANATDVQVIPGVIMFTTPSDKEVGNEFYMTEMVKLGWIFDSLKSNSNQYAYNMFFYKSDLHTAMVVVNIATGVTKVQIIYTGTE